MIQSDTLPQQAIDYLNQIQEAKNAEAILLGRQGARQELHNWCLQWYTTAQKWRKQSFEDDWLSWQRNADGRYDPRLAQKKKDWQSKAFVDMTPSHRENIHAELFRLVCGSDLMDVTERPSGDPNQSQNIKDLTMREIEKSRYLVEYNKALEDRTTYGDGFMRFWFETKMEDRITRVPQYEPLDLFSKGSILRHMTGNKLIVGYQNQKQKKLIYRGVRARHISIWDFFPDPKALEIKGHPCLIRSWMSLQQILDSIKSGIYMPEAGPIMREQASLETQPPDKSLLQMERGIADVAPRREGNQKVWEAYEMFARVPQKWAYPLLSEPMPVDDADGLVPVRIIFNKQTIFGVFLNDDYDGEPPIIKDSYYPVAGRFYSRGIPEMLKNPQMVVNEVVNQRLDEGNLALQEGVAVIEKALVNPEDLLAGGPGLVVRIDGKKLGPNGDVKGAIMPLGRPDVKSNAGFVEVHEWERMAADRTSVARTVIGPTAHGDAGTRTLGGMQMLKRQAGEKFAFIAMLSEQTAMYEVFRMIWRLIYSNYTMQDVVNALGPERARGFQLISPDDIEQFYKYQPKGIFEQEAKATRQARIAALRQQYGMKPWWNDMASFDLQAQSFEVDPQRLKVPEAEAMEIMGKAQMMAEPMAKQMISQIIIGQAVKDVERNLAEKMADERDGAKQEEVKGVPDLAGKPKPSDEVK